MDSPLHRSAFDRRLDAFKPARFVIPRALAIYSAAIAVSSPDSLRRACGLARGLGASSTQLCEVLLQSYLFLGFPRMLNAAMLLDFAPARKPAGGPPDPADMQQWYPRGLELCKKVYGSNFEKLRVRVEDSVPEIFRWMLLEGYGKVLSRPGLDLTSREAAIVACLIIDNRPSQLYSHMRGALNVGTPPELLIDVVEDLGDAVGPGYAEAHTILNRLRVI